MNEKTLIIIPAYEPDERLLSLLEDLSAAGRNKIMIVDDGSGDKYSELFERAKNIISPDGVLLSYPDNKGKGGALKTAFRYVLDNMPDVLGVITADSDGQHTVSCIKSVEEKLLANPNALILGVRSFDTEDVPWKSELGNKLTIKVLKYVSGLSVSDTQTGLRGIPVGFLPECLNIKQNRFEYEMEMLLRTRDNISIIETPIETVYDSKDNHQTHFNPFLDSIKIYRVLGRQFLSFIFASLSSSIIDIGLFALFCYLLKAKIPESYIIVSTVMARIISACYNYTINYMKVFHSKSGVAVSGVKYLLLAIIQMACSALLVHTGARLLPFISETIIKIVIDTILFLISYKIQQLFVFSSKKKIRN